MTKNKLVYGVLMVLALVLASSGKAWANHSWGGYHWARTANPFTLKAGNNLSASWSPFLNIAASKWSESTVLDLVPVAGLANPKNCRPTSGRVEVCNAKYGNNGWLGIAQIWLSGSHIAQGTTKLNDSYFSKPTYNTTAWKNLVMCQEVGHTFGLDHQDETFDNANKNTCMDYTNNPESNQYPNAHDYEELELIYAHLDGFTTVSQTVASIATNNFENRGDWGRVIRDNGKVAVFERDFGMGQKLLTHVIWAE